MHEAHSTYDPIDGEAMWTHTGPMVCPALGVPVGALEAPDPAARAQHSSTHQRNTRERHERRESI